MSVRARWKTGDYSTEKMKDSPASIAITSSMTSMGIFTSAPFL